MSAFHAHMQNRLRGSPRGRGFACAVRWSASGTPIFHSWAEQHSWELAGKKENSSELLSPDLVSALRSVGDGARQQRCSSCDKQFRETNGNSFSLWMPCQMGPGPKQALCNSLRELGTWGRTWGRDLGGSQPTHLPRAQLRSRARMQDLCLRPTRHHPANGGTSTGAASSPSVFCRKGRVAFPISSQAGRGNQEARGA